MVTKIPFFHVYRSYLPFWMSTEMEELAKHGTTLPPNMQGLTEEQISDLRLRDEWEDKCSPSGGYVETKDPLTKRNGRGNKMGIY